MTIQERIWARGDDQDRKEERDDLEQQREDDRRKADEMPAWRTKKVGTNWLWCFWIKKSDPENVLHGWAVSESLAEQAVKQQNGGGFLKCNISPNRKRLLRVFCLRHPTNL